MYLITTKERYYRRRAARIHKRMEQIAAKHPEVNFNSPELRYDMGKYAKLMIDLIHARVNADECHSTDPDQICERCECRKSKK